MSERIVFRSGKILVTESPLGSAAAPEVIIGELDGPVGTALATLTGHPVPGLIRTFATLNTAIQIRPLTLMVSKVTVEGKLTKRYTNILLGTVQAAIAHGVLDAVRAGDIPKDKVNDLGILISVWLNPMVGQEDYECDHQALFNIHRQATAQVIHQAMHHLPDIDWLLEHQDQLVRQLAKTLFFKPRI